MLQVAQSAVGKGQSVNNPSLYIPALGLVHTAPKGSCMKYESNKTGKFRVHLGGDNDRRGHHRSVGGYCSAKLRPLAQHIASERLHQQSAAD